jgi:sister chromatid cohesion protein DCC1
MKQTFLFFFHNKARRKPFTLDQARIELQASEEELAQALKEKHVLIIDGDNTRPLYPANPKTKKLTRGKLCSTDALRPLSPSYLHKILELLLMHVVSLSQSHDAASVLELSRSLEYDHEVKREVSLQVMRWFGEIDATNELWKMDVQKVVRQVGLGVLRQHKAGSSPSLILYMASSCFFAG